MQALKRIRTRHFQAAKEEGSPFTGLTSYDMLTAQIFDEAGLDFLLVGDSVGNNVLGYDTTLPVTLDDMIHHTRAVVRGQAARDAWVCPDGPLSEAEVARAYALFVLTLQGNQISAITWFADSSVLPRFGLPRMLG